MSPEKLEETPHRRFNPLTREWVLVSPHRAKRPWPDPGHSRRHGVIVRPRLRPTLAQMGMPDTDDRTIGQPAGGADRLVRSRR